jgi:hypothetical protein
MRTISLISKFMGIFTFALLITVQVAVADQILVGALNPDYGTTFGVTSSISVAQQFNLSSRSEIEAIQLNLWCEGGMTFFITDGLSSSAHVYSEYSIEGSFSPGPINEWDPSIMLSTGNYFLVAMVSNNSSYGGLVASNGVYYQPNGNSVGPVFHNSGGWDSWTMSPTNMPAITFQISGDQRCAAPVPEPSTILLLGSGIAGIFVTRKKI